MRDDALPGADVVHLLVDLALHGNLGDGDAEVPASRAARGLREAAFRVVREVAIVAEAVADARHVAGFRVVNMLDGSVNFAAGEND